MKTETKRTGWRSAMRLCAASLALAAGGTAWADITWTGAGGDSNWETTSNWNGYDTTTGMLLDHSTVSDAYEIDISSNPERAAYIWVAAANGVTLKASGTYGLNQTGGDIRVGTWANGTLTIDGGTHIINSLVVASGWWSNFAPTGVMTIKGGATVTAGWNALGDTDSDTTSSLHNPTSSGTLNVENASVAFTSDFLVGRLAVGTLNVNNGGVVSCQGADSSARWTSLGEAASGNGTINLNAGGTLAVWHIQKGSGSAAINFNGGTLKTLGNTGNCEYILGNDGAPATGPAVSIGAKGAVFDSNGLDTKVGVAVTGVGTITKKGAGTLTFSGDMSGFIGKVAVANGAGSVTLPASAERARAGDYTAVEENQDGTFTFSYDANGSAATTATATLLSLDFEDDSYDEDVSGWSLSGYGGSEQGERILTNGTASKFLHLWTGTGSGVRQYKGTCTLPSDVVNSDNYAIEFDWFAARQNDIHTTEDRDLGLFIYAGSEELVRVVSNISKLSGNSAQIYLKDSLSETTIATASRGARCDGTNNQDYWYHVIIKSNNENGLTFKLVAADGTTSFAETRVCDHVNITSIVVDLNRSRDKVSGSGNTPAYSGIDDLLATIPAVVGVDGVNYATFAEAVAAATSTSTITLYSDVELTSNVELPYGATLDLNGYALYTTDENVAVTFDDGVHYLESTAYAGGYKTFTANVTMDATVYVWTGDGDGSSWSDPANWSLGGSTATSAPTSDAEVLFPSTEAQWTLTLSGTQIIGTVNFGGNTKINGGLIATDAIVAADNVVVTLGENGGIVENTSALDIPVTLKIEGTEANPSVLRADTHENTCSGDLLGKGVVVLQSGNDLCGVTLSGNNTEFYGTIVVNAAERGALRTASGVTPSGSSKNATFIINGTGKWNESKLRSSFLKGSYGEYHFGSLRGTLLADSTQQRNNTVYIGYLNSDSDSVAGHLAYESANHDRGQTIHKVGSGSMTFTATRAHSIYIDEGVLDVAVADPLVYNAIYFNGGELKIGSNCTADLSGKLSFVAGKTATLDDGGEPHQFETAIGNDVAANFVKKGTGTLTLAQEPTYTGTTTVEEGTLITPNTFVYTPGENTKVTTVGNTYVFTHTTPVAPGETAATTYDSEEEATAAAANVAVAVPTDVAAELTTTEAQEAYKEMFEAKAVKTSTGSGVWTVTVDFKDDVKTEIQAAEDAISVVDGATPKVTVAAKPGLYYFVKAGTAADSDSLTVTGNGELATDTTVELDMPLPDSGVKYYKVVASPTSTL